MGRPLQEHDTEVLAGRRYTRGSRGLIPVVQCRLCRQVWTESVGTKLCDPCWELSTRVRHSPELAIRAMLIELTVEEIETIIRKESRT